MLSLMVSPPPLKAWDASCIYLSAAFSDRVTTHGVLNKDDITMYPRDKMGSRKQDVFKKLRISFKEITFEKER